MAVLITGGMGFIGSNFILDWIRHQSELIINLDKLTYAGNEINLSSLKNHKYYRFVLGDIQDKIIVKQILEQYQPRAIINFAAESHVDRAIDRPDVFLKTNVLGTLNLLHVAYTYWEKLSKLKKNDFRFLHISTDEVYGSLSPEDPPFTEKNCYSPNNPYSASKASSDHLMNAYFKTYQFPTLVTNCSNNYGPYQSLEKFIPLIITHSILGKDISIYGDGMQIRDWIYVLDHCKAIQHVLDFGKTGNSYNIGASTEKNNIEIVHTICDILDEIYPVKHKGIKSYREYIRFVKDRKGHDRRYAIDATKIQEQLHWAVTEKFENGIIKTVQWYLENPQWISVVSTKY